MAWQPVYGPKVGRGLVGLGDDITEAMQARQARKLQEENMARLLRGEQLEQQRHAENKAIQQQHANRLDAQARQGALEKAMAIVQKHPRNPMAAAAAASLLKNAGFNVGTEDVYEDVPGMQQAQPQRPDVAGGSAAPDQIENAQPSRTPQMDAYQRTTPGEVEGETSAAQLDPNVRRALQVRYGGRVPPEAIAQAQVAAKPLAPGDAPIPMADQNRSDRRLAGRRLIATFGQGDGAERFVLDPIEHMRMQEQERQEAAQRAATSFGGGQYGALAAELTSQGVDADTVARVVTARMEKEQGRQAAIEMENLRHQHQLEQDQKRPRSAGLTVIQPGAEASGANAVLGGVRSDVDKWEETSGFAQHAKDYASLSQGLADIKSGNQTRARGAVIGLGRTIMGPGQFTEGEQRLVLGKTGGTWNDVESSISRVLSGKYGEGDMQIYLRAIEGKLEAARGYLAQDQQSFQRQFRQGSAYQNVQQNMFDAEASRFERFGLKPLPLPEGAGGVSYGTPTQKKAEMRGGKPSPAAKARRADAARKGVDLDKWADEIVTGAMKRK